MLLYLLLVEGLQIEVCEGSASAHAAFVPLDKVAIQLQKEQIALSSCFRHSQDRVEVAHTNYAQKYAYFAVQYKVDAYKYPCTTIYKR